MQIILIKHQIGTPRYIGYMQRLPKGTKKGQGEQKMTPSLSKNPTNQLLFYFQTGSFFILYHFGLDIFCNLVYEEALELALAWPDKRKTHELWASLTKTNEFTAHELLNKFGLLGKLVV